MNRILTLLLVAFALFAAPCAKAGDDSKKETAPVADLYSIPFQDAKGTTETLGLYRGKTIIVVNTASQCGFTPQYSDLQKLYSVYGDKGVVVVAFPANDFGGQEPGTNEEIQDFCSSKYRVTFPVKGKMPVLGEGKSPLYAALTGPTSPFPGEVGWNFEKFVISPEGKIVGRFKSKVSPMSKEFLDAVETAGAPK